MAMWVSATVRYAGTSEIVAEVEYAEGVDPRGFRVPVQPVVRNEMICVRDRVRRAGAERYIHTFIPTIEVQSITEIEAR